jgi:hypothetical protein
LKFELDKNLLSGWSEPLHICEKSKTGNNEKCWSTHEPHKIISVFLKDKGETDYKRGNLKLGQLLDGFYI